MKNRSFILSVFLFGCICTQLWAQGIPWEDLSDDEKAVLTPFKNQWSNFPKHRQDNLRKGVNRWQSLTPKERQAFKKRFGKWKNFSPEKRQRIRKRFKRYSEMSPEKRKQLKKRYQNFKKLPLEKRKRLRRIWRDSGYKVPKARAKRQKRGMKEKKRRFSDGRKN